MTRYQWSTHRTRLAAELSLEADFAEGTISPAERPKIERRGAVYVVTLEG